MKTTYIIAGILAVTMGVTAISAQAQHRGGGGERPAFSDLDLDGSGEVTLAELEAFGVSRFNEADTNGDGALSLDEIIAQRDVENQERLQRRVERFIERADDNGNGAIELEEFGQTAERMERRFERMDADSSGGISEEEMADARDHRGGGDRGGKKDKRGGGERKDG
ncbi:MAG: EF-hand domain-containing protein [Pseudomonadota bacterium]